MKKAVQNPALVIQRGGDVMKKKVALFIVFLLMAVSLLFSKGANEKAYDSFWSILKKHYPMYYVAQSKGLDLKSIEENGRTKFSEESTQDEMIFLFRRLSFNFVNLDYINVFFPSVYDGSGSSDPENHSSLKRSPGYTYIPSLRTVILTIPSFASADLKEDFILQSIGNLDVENIIFNVTGNLTGNNQDDISALLAPFGGCWDYSYRAYYRNRYTAELFFNADEIKEAKNKLYKDEYRLPYYVDVTRSYDFGDGTLNDRLRNAQRWILVDSETGYTADFFASFAKATGWAKVVGHRTKGNGTGLPFIYTFLNGKNYVLAFNSTVTSNNQGGLKALSGTIPDITADDGRSALKLCLDLIESRL